MSECLITSIVVAPKRFSAAAIARAEKLAAALDQVQQSSEGPAYEALEALGVCCSAVENTFGEELPDCSKLLERFIAWWHDGAREHDTNHQDLPGYPDWGIVVAGGTSYGDMPSGEGYRRITEVDALGLLSILIDGEPRHVFTFPPGAYPLSDSPLPEGRELPAPEDGVLTREYGPHFRVTGTLRAMTDHDVAVVVEADTEEEAAELAVPMALPDEFVQPDSCQWIDGPYVAAVDTPARR